MTHRDRRTGEARERPRIVDAFLEEALSDREDARVDYELLLATEPTQPSRELRERLLGTLAVTHRFDDLEARVAELVDVPRERAAALLLDIDTDGVWDRGALPGVDVFHFTGGPKVENAITGFVRVTPGAAFPQHEHVGDEKVLVLTGTLEDSSGALYDPGALVEMPAGSRHGFRAMGPRALLLMTVIQGGVIIGGQLIPPGDPRA